MQTLWRVDGLASSLSCDDDALGAGLALHLRYCSLTVLVRRQGAAQRVYLGLPACAGCAGERCEPGCYVELTRRLLRVTHAARLSPVSAGLAATPYRAGALAWPTPAAQALDDALVGRWDSAQLLLDWKRARRAPPFRVGALLLTDAALPHPAAALRAYGWRSLPLPPALAALLGDRAWRVSLPFKGPWAGAPFLLAEAAPPAPAAVSSEAPSNDSPAASTAAATLGQRLAHELRALLQGDAARDAALVLAPASVQSHDAGLPARHAEAARQASDDAAAPIPKPVQPSLWPAGPGRMQPDDVALLVEQLQTSPIVHGVEPGITRKRLAQLLPDDQAEYARQFMLWLHAAGVLSDPNPPEAPFRNPRPLQIVDGAELAARLRATPLPTAEAAKAAMQA